MVKRSKFAVFFLCMCVSEEFMQGCFDVRFTFVSMSKIEGFSVDPSISSQAWIHYSVLRNSLAPGSSNDVITNNPQGVKGCVNILSVHAFRRE
jgi:hypothetical protein